MTQITFTPADYTEIRRRSVDLHSKIFKKLTKDDDKTCAKHLGVWRNKAVALESDEEVDLFADYAIYGYRPRGFNMAEKYLRLFSRDADEFELALLRHMRHAHYAIYQADETDGNEFLQATDVFSKQTYRLLDRQMAQTAYTGLMLAGYLIDFDDFTIQTGGTVKVTREILQADEVVHVIDHIEDEQLASFLSDAANGAKLARAVVSAAFRLGQTGNFQHQAV
ncbi:hypothetical protein [Methylomonas rivi]|uniref:Uncharacterized protein n=1 Tax=Methylomonas rivi TaxID=2952226 RepID=A0ABT1U388_9GAMM|nr:hypothetical protein [Methylomonas sp. WSC-6]MCQ8128302.1 hypothetical protein [Methylomonas sp. WSC-6]